LKGATAHVNPLFDVPERSGVQEKLQEPAKPPNARRRRRTWLVLIPLLALSIAGAAYYLDSRQFEWTDDAFIEGRVTSVSAKVSAHVEKLLVDDNWDVTAGQLLLELDARDFEARLAQARAQHEAAKSRLLSAEAGVVRAKAELEASEADVAATLAEADRAALDKTRYESAGSAVTKQSLDNARALATTTMAQHRAAREKAASARSQVPYAESQVAVARAEIEQANAQLREAELQLSYTRVTAPVSGRVTRRSVEVGQFVQPGESLLAVVERGVWVVANFRETQLDLMRPGQTVAISIDAYPERELRGRVESIMRGTGARFSLLPPENATGNYVKVVQRVPVKILFTEELPRERELGVGLSVVPTVRVRASPW
jgi:membrane fusion protein (multidrug efflux system)